ncbi:hypothetical protein TNCV_2134251 [Trichonephila clavipes]|nr:hypothetical protein TNCV_2134251 [Trichonephila clavipes]
MLVSHGAAQRRVNTCYVKKFRQDFLQDRIHATIQRTLQKIESNKVVSKNAGPNIDRETLLSCMWLLRMSPLEKFNTPEFPKLGSSINYLQQGGKAGSDSLFVCGKSDAFAGYWPSLPSVYPQRRRPSVDDVDKLPDLSSAHKEVFSCLKHSIYP